MKLDKILVPLDGSTLAEAALSTACGLAARDGSTISLLRAVEASTLTGDPVAAQVTAILAAGDEEGEFVLQVALRADAGGQIVARALQFVDDDVQESLAELADAVASIGVPAIRLAEGFDAAGQPLRERDFPPALVQ